MTHISLINKSRSKPSLEFCTAGMAKARRVLIDKSPFRIGRAESSDLRIDSGQVSREHAELLNRGGVWFVRDLGSTNGTHINGKRVTETILVDGDVLRVAETELTFIASPTSQFQRMVTHPIHVRGPRSAASVSIPTEVAAARALADATMWQAIPLSLSAAVSHENHVAEAVFTKVIAGEGAVDPRSFFGSQHVAGARYRQIFRLRSIEMTKRAAVAERIFVPVDLNELESNQRLLAELEQLQALLPADWELGVTVPISAVLEAPHVSKFYRAARDHGLLLAYDDFHGNGGQIMQVDSDVPDYLLLSDIMLQGQLSEGQPLQRLESIKVACDELGIKPVLPRCQCERTRAKCRGLGFDLAMEKPGRNKHAVREFALAR